MTIEIYINDRGSHQSLVDKYFTPIESIENEEIEITQFGTYKTAEDERLSVQEAEHCAFHCKINIKSSVDQNFVKVDPICTQEELPFLSRKHFF